MITAISNNIQALNPQVYKNKNLYFCGNPINSKVQSLVSDIPPQLRDMAIEFAKRNIYFSRNNQPYHKLKHFAGLCLSGTPEENARIAFKLDFLAELDPNLYVGTHQHPYNYIHDMKGYECVDRFGFDKFEKALDLKLYEFALLAE